MGAIPALLDRLGIEFPVVQAGMGSGLAGHELAAAVSEAGGLGTIGIVDPSIMADQLADARRLTDRPLAVNIIVPFSRRGHWRLAGDADVFVTHWEARPRRRAAGLWIHTVGSAEEARAAVAAGADAVIAQGVESGGHVRGELPALELLDRVRAVVPAGFPALVAGGIAGPQDVSTALEAGAAAAIAGTRFLATDESAAHPGYKQRLVDGEDTHLTELFGMGWARAPHRVLPNEATERWLQDDPRGPAKLRGLHSMLAPAARLTPIALQIRLSQRASAAPLDLSPAAPTAGMSPATLETHPLYAGETVARIHDVRPAAAVVRELVP